jgi:hypothetical protein
MGKPKRVAVEMLPQETSDHMRDLAKQVVSRLSLWDPTSTLQFVELIIEEGKIDGFRDILSAMEIVKKLTIFRPESAKQAAVLERVMTNLPFQAWLERHERRPSRSALMDYWTHVMAVAKSVGLVADTIDPRAVDITVLKATRTLANKMTLNPAAYAYLAPLNINHAAEVSRALGQIKQPIPFLEVLVGEAFEDMQWSQKFLSAWCLLDIKDAVENCVASIMLCLQSKE